MALFHQSPFVFQVPANLMSFEWVMLGSVNEQKTTRMRTQTTTMRRTRSSADSVVGVEVSLPWALPDDSPILAPASLQPFAASPATTALTRITPTCERFCTLVHVKNESACMCACVRACKEVSLDVQTTERGPGPLLSSPIRSRYPYFYWDCSALEWMCFHLLLFPPPSSHRRTVLRLGRKKKNKFSLRLGLEVMNFNRFLPVRGRKTVLLVKWTQKLQIKK